MRSLRLGSCTDMSRHVAMDVVRRILSHAFQVHGACMGLALGLALGLDTPRAPAA